MGNVQFGRETLQKIWKYRIKEEMKKDYDMKTNEFICKRPWQLLKATEDELDQVCNIMQVCWDIHPEIFQLTGDLIGYSSAPLHPNSNLQIGRSFSTRIGNQPLSSLIN